MLRDKAIRAMEKEVRAINAETITNHMTEIREARAKLNLMAELWADPVRVLMRSTLASEARAIYADNLAHAGPFEVEEAARAAVMENDKDLAAAVCVRIDSMGKEPRKLLTTSKADLGEVIMAEDIQAARVNLGVAGIHADMAELAVREATGSKVRPEEKIGLDMRIRDLEKSLGISVAEAFKSEEKTIIEAGPKIAFEDQSKPAPKSEALQRVDAWNDFCEAYKADEYDKAREIAAKWGFDVFEDQPEDSTDE